MKPRGSDPAANRCQGATNSGQCTNPALEGRDYCAVCGGGRDLVSAQNRRQYMLAKAQHRKRLAELSDHDEIKSLRDDVAMARMLIEQRFNMIETDGDLIAACGQLNQLLLTVERLVKSCHVLEQNLGVLLSRQSALRLGQTLCQIVIDELEGLPDYEGIIDQMVPRILEAIATAGNEEPVRSVSLLPGPAQ